MPDTVAEKTAELPALAWLPGHPHVGKHGRSSHLPAQLRGRPLPGKLLRTKRIG